MSFNVNWKPEELDVLGAARVNSVAKVKLMIFRMASRLNNNE